MLVLGLAGKRYYHARLMTNFKSGIKRAIFQIFLYSRQIPDEEVLSDLENDVQQLESSYIESTVIIVSSLGFIAISIAYTLWTNFYLGLVGKKLKEKEKISLMKQALNRVNLSYLDLNQPIFELSGGEAQRVALAKIILKDPPLILADEPTAPLDPKNSEELLSILEFLKNPNRTIIIATHNPLIWEQVDQVIRVTDLSHR